MPFLIMLILSIAVFFWCFYMALRDGMDEAGRTGFIFIAIGALFIIQGLHIELRYGNTYWNDAEQWDHAVRVFEQKKAP